MLALVRCFDKLYSIRRAKELSPCPPEDALPEESVNFVSSSRYEDSAIIPIQRIPVRPVPLSLLVVRYSSYEIESLQLQPMQF